MYYSLIPFKMGCSSLRAVMGAWRKGPEPKVSPGKRPRPDTSPVEVRRPIHVPLPRFTLCPGHT